jgi:RHS repeat-associated protein
LEHLWYDKNGNIKNLLRNGGMDTDGFQFANPIDNLTYLYDTDNKNQLLRVFDATANTQGFKDDTDGSNISIDIAQAPDYAYDANGNMIRDDNKGIKTITYNHLNLPTKITFANGNFITYLYNAVGQKLGKVVTEKVVAQTVVVKTDYLSGFQYVNDVMQYFPHAEGYVKVTGTSYDYVYNYTDHLGNIRLSYSKEPASNALKVIEENHYYPFGLKHTGYNSDKYYIAPRPGRPGSGYYDYSEIEFIPYNPANFNASLNYDYKYNGKELQDELGLNMYDYGARNYDPAIGRWMNIDPLADERDWMTPYNYVQNNPLSKIDPYGLTDFTINKKTGEINQNGDENNEPDRILKTDRNGNIQIKGKGFLGFLVRKSERGKAKVEIDKIEKGILKNGINFKDNDNLIDVGGENQPTIDGVKDFVVKLSNLIDKEISGFEFSKNNSMSISTIAIPNYGENTDMKALNDFNFQSTRPDLLKTNTLRNHFHTHLDKFSDTARRNPSPADTDFRDETRRHYPNTTFEILTPPHNFKY